MGACRRTQPSLNGVERNAAYVTPHSWKRVLPPQVTLAIYRTSMFVSFFSHRNQIPFGYPCLQAVSEKRVTDAALTCNLNPQ